MHPSASVSLDTATVWFPPSLRENSSCGVHSPIQLCVLCHFSRARLCNTMDGSPPGSSVHGILQARILDWVAMPFPSQGSNPGLPYCRRILYCLSYQGSPITGVGSLFLLQGIFPTQELNQDLLHCRWIFYQLSYQGSPRKLSLSFIILNFSDIGSDLLQSLNM